MILALTMLVSLNLHDPNAALWLPLPHPPANVVEPTATQDSEGSPPTLRIRLRDGEGALEVEVTQTRRFADLDAFLAWLEDQQGDGRVIIEAGKHVEYGSIAKLFEAVRSHGISDIELALADAHEAYLDRVRQRMEEEPFLQGTWLEEYYRREFGEQAPALMWRDLDRAMREGRFWLALNLMENLPNVHGPDGTKMYYGANPTKATIAEEGLRNYLQELALPEDGSRTGQMAVDPLARIVEKRAVEFLLDYASQEHFSMWERQSAIRALRRITSYDEVMGGMGNTNWLISPNDDEATRRMHEESVAELREWWRTAKADYPAQVNVDWPGR